MTAVTLPAPLRGPHFGSYAAQEVGWLLKDLSGVDLEADAATRYTRIDAGTGHYAESLPKEYMPSAAYQKLFDAALVESAPRLATAVGVLTDLVLAERGTNVVLVSLARAGTPVAILMRRWAAAERGLTLDHYAVSIVRERGIDLNALRWLATHYNSADIVFVDGWTGKGAITRELAEAIEAANTELGTSFNPDLAVLADPGVCSSTFGTRDDFLIASACLNSTVSGLVSRTVLNKTLIGPDDYHGGKFYAELGAADVSNAFLDTVSAAFAAVRSAVEAELSCVRASDRTPTWAGWAAVEQVCVEYGVSSVNRVKPSVGETTRVLLRRVPWKILIRPDAAADLGHILLLAGERGVEVVEVPGLAYACMGLIASTSSAE